MFPSTQARGLRYKAILYDCRKQSQEMEMRCVTLSATSGYLFGRIFLFFLHGNPPPSITLWVPELMSGSWRNKPAVSCSLLRLQGGITSLPLVPHHITPTSSSSKQNPMWGIQLVNLTLDTLLLVCSTDTPFLLITSCRRAARGRESQSCSK